MGAGIIGSLVISHLRLLTPKEVDRLTETLADHQKLKPISLLTEADSGDVDSSTDSDQHQSTQQTSAKIIPLHKISDEEDPDALPPPTLSSDGESLEVHSSVENESPPDFVEVESPPPAPPVSGNLALKRHSIFGPSEEELAEMRRREEEKRRRPSTTMFILAQKEKSRRSQEALKGKDAVATYKRNSYVDIVAVEEDEEEDLASSTTKGILINKKQF